MKKYLYYLLNLLAKPKDLCKGTLFPKIVFITKLNPLLNTHAFRFIKNQNQMEGTP